jgi:hypothetical protein
MKEAVEHMNGKKEDVYYAQPAAYKPKRYYQHSSMEFPPEEKPMRHGEIKRGSVPNINGNFQSVQSSGGNLNTQYSSQTPVSQYKRQSSSVNQDITSTPYSMNDSRSVAKLPMTTKLSTKQISDDDLGMCNESFEDTIMDESQMSIGVDDFEHGPSMHTSTVHREIDFSKHRMSNTRTLDQFMDEQLQMVAEKLADKKSLEKYNMVLRMNMKSHMADIQEMLDDSNNIQSRLNKDKQKMKKSEVECEDIEFELTEIRYRIQEIREKNSQEVEELEQYKSDLYYHLSDDRDSFQQRTLADREHIEMQKIKISKLDENFRYFEI